MWAPIVTCQQPTLEKIICVVMNIQFYSGDENNLYDRFI